MTGNILGAWWSFLWMKNLDHVHPLKIQIWQFFELPLGEGSDAPHMLEAYLKEEFIFIRKSMKIAGSRSTKTPLHCSFTPRLF